MTIELLNGFVINGTQDHRSPQTDDAIAMRPTRRQHNNVICHTECGSRFVRQEINTRRTAVVVA